MPGYELELRGDDGAVVHGAAEGALWVRGPSACSGYWNDRARTLSTFHGAWTRTGDRYARAADGMWTYCGRDDDMLKVGGIWVSPFEVESALAAHPAVLEAAVVGAQDGDGLVKPKAFVVLRDRDAPVAPTLSSTSCRALRQGDARAVQVSALDRRRHRAAEDRDRQDPAVQAARRAVTSFLDVDGLRLEAAWIGAPAPRALVFDPTAPPFGGASHQRSPVLDPTAPPFGGASHQRSPVLVFLHEGLGSITQWRDTPAAIADASGRAALVYARAGYGHSTPVAVPRPLTYMHDEAARLPAVLAAAGVREAILVGHSDGASIALIAAATTSMAVRGLVLIAPHVFVEDISVRSIAAAADAYTRGELRTRLAKYHDDVDGAFWGWNRAWLDPGFRSVETLEALLPADPRAGARRAGRGRRLRHARAGRRDRGAARRAARRSPDDRGRRACPSSWRSRRPRVHARIAAFVAALG